MATKTYIEFYDDLNGNKGAATVEFMLDGVHYEIDLDSRNERNLRDAFADYIAYGRRKTAPTPKKQKSGRKQSRAKQLQNARIREWGTALGYEVPTHGRLPVVVKSEYFKKHETEVEVLR